MFKGLVNYIANLVSNERRMKKVLEKNEAIHRSNGYAHSTTISVISTKEKKAQNSVARTSVTASRGTNDNSQSTPFYNTAMAVESNNEPCGTNSTYNDTSSDSGSSSACD